MDGEEVDGSTLKVSAMQFTATSMDSASSEERVPSVVDLVRKSQIASARRCFGVACGLSVSILSLVLWMRCLVFARRVAVRRMEVKRGEGQGPGDAYHLEGVESLKLSVWMRLGVFEIVASTVEQQM